jgi:hypothetical protein
VEPERNGDDTFRLCLACGSSLMEYSLAQHMHHAHSGIGYQHHHLQNKGAHWVFLIVKGFFVGAASGI